MSFLEIFTVFASGVTIFALIVGVFSVYNGRGTRRTIAGLNRDTQTETQRLIRQMHEDMLAGLRETRELIARESQATRELIARESEATRELITREVAATRQLIQESQVATREILLRITEILARIDERVR